ncbi:SAM-dependent methyltransferase [Arthrobacter sp. MYb227]|uniref:class I SAM-dependent methyltransferase n=1 Tax=Arthrobacter sp. MYb227 TaxID=1848601 RepID=UPI000CFDA306|nr:class I SAM-dependent methyltransferase [Arthrobacter sp. MYb227]PQZ86989.1 SAM-dependent methyltransferase [Arthrobacter sp. MYb227]
MSRTFEDLVAEAQHAPIDGWDFSWFQGRATEERPSWGYSRLLAERLPAVDSALDLQTGGGEVLAGVPRYPRLMVATEGWEPNIAKATELLHPRGVEVVADDPEPPLPFADESFELVTSRHPVIVHWEEIARVLRPGGSYLAQHVGHRSVFELVEFFLGEQPEAVRLARHPDFDVKAAMEVGLEITELKCEELRIEFHDIGAVIYFLRLVIWMVPGFTVEAYVPRLREMHELIRAQGSFIAHSTRFLIGARKPA